MHCDLKPENFVIGTSECQETGILYLVDYGLARTYNINLVEKE